MTQLHAAPPSHLFLSPSLSKSLSAAAVCCHSYRSPARGNGVMYLDDFHVTPRARSCIEAPRNQCGLQREQAECRTRREHAWVPLALSPRNHPRFYYLHDLSHVPRLSPPLSSLGTRGIYEKLSEMNTVSGIAPHRGTFNSAECVE